MVTGPINAVTENQPYLWNGKAYELQAWYTRREYDEPHHDMHGDLEAESPGSLFKSPLAGGGGILLRPRNRPLSLLLVNCVLSRALSVL